MSDANRIQLSYAEETTFGTAKTGTNYQIVRVVSETLGQDQDVVNSSELRSDRQVSDVKRVSLSASGAVNVELSYGSHDSWLQRGLMSAAWTSPDTDTQITFSMSDVDNSINDSGSGFVSAGFTQYEWIKTSGFTESANNGIFKIESVAAGKMVLSGGSVTTEAAGDSVTITQGARIVNGTTQKSYTLEKYYGDLTNEYETILGATIDQMTLSVTPGEIITGSFTFLGKSGPTATSAPGSGYDAATTNTTMSAVDDVDAILESQTSLGSTAFTLQVANNLRNRLQIGTLGAISIGSGTINVTGTLQAYYDSTLADIMDKYLDDTETALAVTFTDSAGDSYVIDMPSVKYTSGRRVAGGINTDAIADLAFSAYLDGTEGFTVAIHRWT